MKAEFLTAAAAAEVTELEKKAKEASDGKTEEGGIPPAE